MAMVAASIGAMGVFTDHSFRLAISAILVLYAGVGAVLIADTRRFWFFTLFIGAAGGFHFFAHNLGLGVASQGDGELGNTVIQGIVFWTAAGIFRRVRDQIVTQEQIHRSKDKFLARVGHELRTPLTAVLAYAEMILEDETTPETTRDWVAVIADEANEMSATVDDFTVVARVTNQLLTLSPTTFPLVPEIHKTLSRIRSNHIKPRVTGSEDIHVHADPDRLRQVLRILITNALQHANTAVQVAAGNYGDTTWIKLTDDGPGLPQGVRSLFEASWQPHSEPGQPERLGRGLLVALELSHAMNIDLTYSRQGSVTEFQLVLPTEFDPSGTDSTAPSQVEGMTRASPRYPWARALHRSDSHG
jgi:signal transduction histidine kinase